MVRRKSSFWVGRNACLKRFVSGPKFNNFLPNVGEIAADQMDFRYLDPFRRYIGDRSLKLFEIAPDFGRFYALPNSRG